MMQSAKARYELAVGAFLRALVPATDESGREWILRILFFVSLTVRSQLLTTSPESHMNHNRTFGPDISVGQLRNMARGCILQGRLPVISTRRLKAGYGGFGNACVLCGQPIEREQVEYYVTDVRNGHSFAFHLSCHAAWQLESDELAVSSTAELWSAKLPPIAAAEHRD
jgi:hypothetical protein